MIAPLMRHNGKERTVTLNQITDELKRLSLYDIRSATQQERAEFVTVCHALIAEINRENARGMTKSD